MQHTLLTLIVSLSVIMTGNQFCYAQISPSDASKKLQKNKVKVENIGIGGKITIVKTNKQKFYGTVVEILNDEFEMKVIDSKNNLKIKYSELKSVYKGDGEKNLFTGKRQNPQHGWLYVGALAGGLIVIFLIAASDKNF